MATGTPEVNAVLLDIDGVIGVSWTPIAGAVDAISSLRAAGLRLRFVTNTTSRSRTAVAESLRGMGLDLDDDDVLTAGRATAAYVTRTHPGAACLILNSGDAGEDLADLRRAPNAEGADVVVFGGAGPEFTYDALNEAFRAVLGGAALVAMHRNLHWATSDGDRLDTGAFLHGIEAATRSEAVVIGKPAAGFYAEALRSVGASADDTVMVGDDVVSDVLGAQAVGIRGVLVRTGKYREDEVAAVVASAGHPDHVIDSIADLPGLLGLPTAAG